MYFNGKEALVTGAGGFIGSHLCEALVKSGAKVTAMIRYSSGSSWGNLEFIPSQIKSELQTEVGNIEDPEILTKLMRSKDIVFHLAALISIPYSYDAPRSYVRTNVEGTLNVMEAARRENVEKIIHTSTSETYGTARYTPINEDHSLQGQSPYSATKIGADKIVESYHKSFDLPVVTVRPFNTYGPRQSMRAIIPTIISQALSQPEIRLGALNPTRDLNYVEDIARGFLRAAEVNESAGETINLGFGKDISIGDLAKNILSLMNCDKQITQENKRMRPDNSEVMRLVCDNAKARRIIDWEPTYSLEDGLLKTIDFVSKHIDAYKAGVFAL